MGNSHNECRIEVPAKVKRVVTAAAKTRLDTGITVAELANDEIGPGLIQEVVDRLVPDRDITLIGPADRLAHIALFNLINDHKDNKLAL